MIIMESGLFCGPCGIFTIRRITQKLNAKNFSTSSNLNRLNIFMHLGPTEGSVIISFSPAHVQPGFGVLLESPILISSDPFPFRFITLYTCYPSSSFSRGKDLAASYFLQKKNSEALTRTVYKLNNIR